MLLGSSLLSAATFAQQITGAVQDVQGKAINNATVSLLHSKDSSVAKLAVTERQRIYFKRHLAGRFGRNSLFAIVLQSP